VNIEFDSTAEEPCDWCRGSGFDRRNDEKVCDRCNGLKFRTTSLGDNIIEMLERRFILTPKPVEKK
jgi:DnaJ-class molecular chaperone